MRQVNTECDIQHTSWLPPCYCYYHLLPRTLSQLTILNRVVTRNKKKTISKLLIFNLRANPAWKKEEKRMGNHRRTPGSYHVSFPRDKVYLRRLVRAGGSPSFCVKTILVILPAFNLFSVYTKSSQRVNEGHLGPMKGVAAGVQTGKRFLKTCFVSFFALPGPSLGCWPLNTFQA